MKKKICLIMTIVLLFMTSVYVSAANGKLSGALDVIAADTVMICSSEIGENVLFTENDFKSCLGNVPSQIKIKSLPKETEGTLYLGNSEVLKDQTISASNFSLLTFVPTNVADSSSFQILVDNNYVINCDIRLYESNFPPVAADDGCINAVTHCNVTAHGKLPGYDNDGDDISFEITEYPSKGIVDIVDCYYGNYTYTPYDGVTGNDTFSYRVKDCYGNYSDECIVNYKIIEISSDVVLDDMEGHWAHNAALFAVADDSIDVISEMDKTYFDPDEVLTREEFLRAVMISLGCTELPDVATVFTDDEDISDGYGGFVAAAYKLGIIKGSVVDGDLYFEPHSEISRAEAAVILNRILGVADNPAIPTVNYADMIPTWAESDLRALVATGIIVGDGDTLSPIAPLTKAEAVQIIYTAKNLYM